MGPDPPPPPGKSVKYSIFKPSYQFWSGSPEISQSWLASIQCWAIIGPPAKRHFAGPLLVVFGFSPPHQLKNFCQRWNFLDPRMACKLCQSLHCLFCGTKHRSRYKVLLRNSYARTFFFFFFFLKQRLVPKSYMNLSIHQPIIEFWVAGSYPVFFT